jgi:hypothetical protein
LQLTLILTVTLTLTLTLTKDITGFNEMITIDDLPNHYMGAKDREREDGEEEDGVEEEAEMKAPLFIDMRDRDKEYFYDLR